MKYQVFSENQWVYPDSEITVQNRAELHAPRGADVCFQVLTDCELTGGEGITAAFSMAGCEAVVYQLLTATVPLNSDARMLCTTDYESVKHFVTRKAPFDVYEITRPLDEGESEAGRAAFFVRIIVAADAPVGVLESDLTIRVGEAVLTVPVWVKIYKVRVPALADSEFHMVNWIYYDRLAKDHKVEAYSEKYMEILDRYLDNQIDMRNDYLMIPSGTPVRDGERGRISDGDSSFTGSERCCLAGFPNGDQNSIQFKLCPVRFMTAMTTARTATMAMKIKVITTPACWFSCSRRRR